MKHVVIIGGGISGLEAAIALTDLGHWVTVIEKEAEPGGKLNNWSHLFPDFTSANELISNIKRKAFAKNFTILTGTIVRSIGQKAGLFEIETSADLNLKADAVIVATGFELFDARRKEEYGYKIYDRVITSADLESMLSSNSGNSSISEIKPKRIAFVHCVGSRDEKSGNHYCSKVCCITGVKQAIELKKQFPGAEIFCFYMDLRMYGKHFEELYREAQEKYDIQFIRGRLSEASEKIDKSLLIKAEDTLSGRPLKMNVDMLVLLVGMEAGKGTAAAAKSCKLRCDDSGFLKTADLLLKSNYSETEGIFLAGSCTAPMSVSDSILHARSAALEVNSWLEKSKVLV